jgi:hypothetical protein
VREIAASVREERVVDATVDDRSSGLEGTLRIGGLDLERTVDDERALLAPVATATVASTPKTTSAVLVAPWARKRFIASSSEGRRDSSLFLRVQE